MPLQKIVVVCYATDVKVGELDDLIGKVDKRTQPVNLQKTRSPVGAPKHNLTNNRIVWLVI
jgi:hypothetical protein